MALVTVKKKFQIVIPLQVRRQVGIRVGDLLEAKAERGGVSLVPKSAVDRGIAESLAEFARGRGYGPFDTAEEVLASLHARARKLASRKSKLSRK